jgi:hypothetical protein
LVCVSVALEVGVAGLIIVGHGGERGFVEEFERGGAASGVGEAVDFVSRSGYHDRVFELTFSLPDCQLFFLDQ